MVPSRPNVRFLCVCLLYTSDLKKLANELAEAKNELKAVKDMADNNAAAIVERCV